MSFYLFIVWIHILAAFIWIGGMLFVAFGLAPVTRNIEPISMRGSLLKTIGVRFRLIGWICITILLITGVLNIFNRGMNIDIFLPPQLLGTEFGRTLTAKLTIVLLMIIMSGIHDFFVGPRLTAMMQAANKNNPNLELQKLRWQVSWIARLNTVLAIFLLFLAVRLAR